MPLVPAYGKTKPKPKVATPEQGKARKPIKGLTSEEKISAYKKAKLKVAAAQSEGKRKGASAKKRKPA